MDVKSRHRISHEYSFVNGSPTFLTIDGTSISQPNAVSVVLDLAGSALELWLDIFELGFDFVEGVALTHHRVEFVP